MSIPQRIVFFGLLIALLALGAATLASAQECPPGVPTCKIVVISPQEEQTLTAPNGILAVAEWGNRAGLADIVSAWRQKLATAPAGTVHKPETPDKK